MKKYFYCIRIIKQKGLVIRVCGTKKGKNPKCVILNILNKYTKKYNTSNIVLISFNNIK